MSDTSTTDTGTTGTKRLRHVIIGVGASVLNMHRPALALEAVELVGVSDVNRELGAARAAELGCPFFEDHETMLRETRPEVAVVLTPHPFHAAITIACLEAGCHVLVEKPMAVHVAEADAMIAAAGRAGRLLAVNLQHRHRAEVRTLKRLIREGWLGRVQHIDFVAAWPRMARYYGLVAWRGTWDGEGAGVLLNQAPHNLDLISHLMGLPERVVAWTRTTLHDIETEDTAQAMLEWPDGALGSFHISTAEAGRPERLEIVGTAGHVQLVGQELRAFRLEQDLRTFMQEAEHPFASPTSQPAEVEPETGSGDHTAVYQNLHDAILKGVPLAADGAAGRMSLELANAMIFSSFTQREVELPLDRERYAALLADLRAKRAGVGSAQRSV